MAAVQTVTEGDFADKVVTAAGPVLVDFWAPWCGICARLNPVLDEVALSLGESVRVVRVNVDENRGLAERHGIKSLPTLVLYGGGNILLTITSYISQTDLESRLKPWL